MDLKELRAFCSVASGGGFSRAAAALGVAQSVLSRQVSALEAELGGRLFHRTGRGALPTELGLALLPRAKGVLAESEQLVVSVSLTTEEGGDYPLLVEEENQVQPIKVVFVRTER